MSVVDVLARSAGVGESLAVVTTSGCWSFGSEPPGATGPRGRPWFSPWRRRPLP